MSDTTVPASTPWHLHIDVEGPGEVARFEYHPATVGGRTRTPVVRTVATKDLGRALAELDPDPVQLSRPRRWTVISDQLAVESVRQCVLRRERETRIVLIDRQPVRTVTCVRADPGIPREVCHALPGGRLAFRLKAHFPPMIWDLRYNASDTLQNAYLWCADAPLVSMGHLNHTLRQFRFGNVYEDAHICWGMSVPPTSVHNPLEPIEMFWSIPFNSDLSSGAIGFNTLQIHKLQHGWPMMAEDHEALDLRPETLVARAAWSPQGRTFAHSMTWQTHLTHSDGEV